MRLNPTLMRPRRMCARVTLSRAEMSATDPQMTAPRYTPNRFVVFLRPHPRSHLVGTPLISLALSSILRN